MDFYVPALVDFENYGARAVLLVALNGVRNLCERIALFLVVCLDFVGVALYADFAERRTRISVDFLLQPRAREIIVSAESHLRNPVLGNYGEVYVEIAGRIDAPLGVHEIVQAGGVYRAYGLVEGALVEFHALAKADMGVYGLLGDAPLALDIDIYAVYGALLVRNSAGRPESGERSLLRA